MSSLLQRSIEKNLVKTPPWMKNNIHYEVIMGSQSYGVSSDDSDTDIYAMCIPPKETIFPHLAGAILGFGMQPPRFENWQAHHVKDPSSNKEYDFSAFGIVKYFQLLMDNNPNVIDSLFVPNRCVIHTTSVGLLLRDNRKMFLHKGAWHKFRGYSFSMMHKLDVKHNSAKKMFEFEEKHELPHNVMLSEIENELIKRQLI